MGGFMARGWPDVPHQAVEDSVRGLWRAFVVNTVDPENRGRIQVRLPQFHGAPPTAASPIPQSTGDVTRGRLPGGRQTVPDIHCPWAEPAFPFGGSINQGTVAIPPVGASVWVGFDQGYLGKPVYLGAWYGLGELPAEVTVLPDPSLIKLVKTPGGHVVALDDTLPGTVRITHLNTTMEVLLDGTGGVTIRTNPTNKITIDLAGNVSIEATGNLDATVAGAATLDVAGSINLGTGGSGVSLVGLLTKFNAHTHTDSMAGTTGSPLAPNIAVPGIDSSITVKAKV
jgi:uncharacterized protein involved in type VI secretion and phage assembly